MIKEGEIYEVYDGSGRHWGKVYFKWPHSGSIAGYLEALPEYEEVRPIFKKHEEELSTAGVGDDLEDTAHIIATLGVVLINPDTQEKKMVDPVFVSEKLLLSCDADV